MSPKRKERVAPPAPPGGWSFRYQSQDAVEGWEELSKQAPGPTYEAWRSIASNPRARSDRQHQLRGELGWREVEGMRMEQWQYEVTGAGRVWYAIDDARRTAWLTHAGVGHPKKTE